MSVGSGNIFQQKEKGNKIMTNLVKDLYETIKTDKYVIVNAVEVSNKIENLNEEELFNLRNEVVKFVDEEENDTRENFKKMLALTSIIDDIKCKKGMAI